MSRKPVNKKPAPKKNEDMGEIGLIDKAKEIKEKIKPYVISSMEKLKALFRFVKNKAVKGGDKDIDNKDDKEDKENNNLNDTDVVIPVKKVRKPIKPKRPTVIVVEVEPVDEEELKRREEEELKNKRIALAKEKKEGLQTYLKFLCDPAACQVPGLQAQDSFMEFIPYLRNHQTNDPEKLFESNEALIRILKTTTTWVGPKTCELKKRRRRRRSRNCNLMIGDYQKYFCNV